MLFGIVFEMLSLNIFLIEKAIIMKKLTILLTVIALATSCFEEKGDDFVVMRTPGENTIISEDEAYLYIQAPKDTAIIIEPNEALIQGEFMSEASAEYILRYGHCWSETNEIPTMDDPYKAQNSPINTGTFETKIKDLKILTKYSTKSKEFEIIL